MYIYIYTYLYIYIHILRNPEKAIVIDEYAGFGIGPPLFLIASVMVPALVALYLPWNPTWEGKLARPTSGACDGS